MKKLILILTIIMLSEVSAFTDIKRKVLETNTDKAWNINGKFIKPECFKNNLYEWMSSDNYQEYYDNYILEIDNHMENTNFRKFVNSIGLYLGKEVPLNDILKFH